MPKFYRKILNLLPILFLVLGMNYFVDPAQLYRQKYEQGLADLLLSGKNVAGISRNYNQRTLRKYIIQRLASPKDILVFGSSRSILISADWFPHYTFLNNSVQSGSLQDYIAMYELYEERGLSPKVVILCMDPWILNRRNELNRWQSLMGEYDRGMKRIGMPQENLEIQSFSLDNYIELISPAYFQASFRQYIENIRNPEQTGYYPTTDMYAEGYMIRADGSLGYPLDARSATPEAVLQKAKDFVSDEPVYSLGDFQQLDQDYETTVRAFVKYLVLKKIKVVLFLSPYHPYAYNELIGLERYKIIQGAQKYFIQMGLDEGALVIGSYNPADIPCADDEFYDGMHAREVCVKRIFLKSGLMSDN